MNILIYGAGSLGLLFAKYLSPKNNVEVVLRPDRKKAINNKGLIVIKESDRATVSLNVYDDIKYIKNNPDFIILAVKSFDIDTSLKNISSRFKNIHIVTIQNGIYTEDAAKNIFTKKYILPAYVMIGSKTIDNNTIEEFLNNGMKIGYLDKSSKQKAEQINKLFNNCGINSMIAEDIMKHKWHKMMFYCAGATLNSLTGTKDLEDKHIAWITEQILNEIVLTARNLDLNFNINDLRNDVYNFLMNFKPEKWSASVGEDLKKGKKTEIDYLNGYIVKLSAQFDVDVPFNKLITSLIKTIEQTQYFKSM